MESRADNEVYDSHYYKKGDTDPRKIGVNMIAINANSKT